MMDDIDDSFYLEDTSSIEQRHPYEYIYIAVVAILIAMAAYIKLTYPFWNVQPIFHSYDLWRYSIQQPSFIQRGKPMRTKFNDPVHVKTATYGDLDKDILVKIVDLLQCHYIPSDRVLSTLTETTLTPYLTGQNEATYISVYKEDVLVERADPSTKQENTIQILYKYVAAMVSRHITLYIPKAPYPVSAYYWDFLCTHRAYRAKHISRNLIQTHEYNQRTLNPQILTSFFRKEEDLCKGIVPLCVFQTSTFYLRPVKMPPLPTHYQTRRIYKENTHILMECFAQLTVQTNDVIVAMNDIGSIIALINANQWFVYALQEKDQTLAIYFFKDAQIQYEDIENGRLLHCFACFTTASITNAQFFTGFLHALHNILAIQNATPFRLLMFDHLAEINHILSIWRNKYSPVFENKAAYYLYNMVVPGMPVDKGRFISII
jgi:hypothetical protein